LTLQPDRCEGSEGRGAGAGGAAERLGGTASSLQQKIRLDIDKLRYRVSRDAAFARRPIHVIVSEGRATLTGVRCQVIA
jgi:hypothetical protein